MDFSNYITPVSIAIGVLVLIVIVLLAYRYMYPSRVSAPTTETFVTDTKNEDVSSGGDTETDEDKKRQLLEADDMTHEQPPL
jgi:uncharacterized ion transporter superfamily protein YfcC